MDSDACVDQIVFTIDSNYDDLKESFSIEFSKQVENVDPKFFAQHKEKITRELVAEVDRSFQTHGKALFDGIHRALSNMVFGYNLDNPSSQLKKATSQNADSQSTNATNSGKQQSQSMGSTGFGKPASNITPAALKQPSAAQKQADDFSLTAALQQKGFENHKAKVGVLAGFNPPERDTRDSDEHRVVYAEELDEETQMGYDVKKTVKGSTQRGTRYTDEPEGENTYSETIVTDGSDSPYKLCIVTPTSLDKATLRQKMAEFLARLVPAGATGPVCLVKDQRSLEWYEQRGLRLTASNFGKMFKRRTLDPPEMLEKLVHSMLNPKKYSGKIPALEYGCENEGHAREEYEKKTGNTVTETGFWTRTDCAFLGGSPDGIVVDAKSGETGLLEIKCPYSGRSMKIKEYATTPSSVLETDGKGGFYLKHSHDYYHQMQGCMYLLNMKWCEFVIRTEVDMHIERIHRNDTLINKMIAKFKELYIRFFLPSLATGKHKQSQIEYYLLNSEVYRQQFANLIATPA